MNLDKAIKELKDENGQCNEQCEGRCSEVKNNICTCRDETILSALDQYRAIGTIKECREAREKQIPKKPKHNGCYDNDGVWHEWNGINGRPYELCPNCGINLCCEMPNDRKPKFCDNCGQALDWSETNST